MHFSLTNLHFKLESNTLDPLLPSSLVGSQGRGQESGLLESGSGTP